MRAICSSETSGSLRTTLCHNPEDSTLHTHGVIPVIYVYSFVKCDKACKIPRALRGAWFKARKERGTICMFELHK
jgi:hypothetical protein